MFVAVCFFLLHDFRFLPSRKIFVQARGRKGISYTSSTMVPTLKTVTTGGITMVTGKEYNTKSWNSAAEEEEEV